MSSTAVKELAVIRLSEHSVQLSEVVIRKTKPLLEQQIDRLVVNVENSLTLAGNTVLEILVRSPGGAETSENTFLIKPTALFLVVVQLSSHKAILWMHLCK